MHVIKPAASFQIDYLQYLGPDGTPVREFPAALRDPAVLVLDEATAMFDPAGELEFIHECQDLLHQRTVLLITHRPASLALADRVLHLDGGRLQEVAGGRAGGVGGVAG